MYPDLRCCDCRTIGRKVMPHIGNGSLGGLRDITHVEFLPQLRVSAQWMMEAVVDVVVIWRWWQIVTKEYTWFRSSQSHHMSRLLSCLALGEDTTSRHALANLEVNLGEILKYKNAQNWKTVLFILRMETPDLIFPNPKCTGETFLKSVLFQKWVGIFLWIWNRKKKMFRIPC